MPAPTHRLERLTLEVEVADLGAAVGLRDRIEELADGAITRTLERLLEELAPAGLTVELDRIELDLGVFDPDRLEADAPGALEAALRRALSQAIAEARAAGACVQTAEEAALDEFETYLVRGAAPLGDGATTPGEALQALISAQPQALARMLRRRAVARHVIERLVLQAGEAALNALLTILAPADAAVIQTYLAELGRACLAAPGPPFTEPVLRRTLRVLTFEYLLRDPGGEFNRKSYLEVLLRGLAQAQGVTYQALLSILLAALPATLRRRPIAGSLPGMLALLAQETGVAPTQAPTPARGPIAQAAAGDLAPLLSALRRAAGDPAALDRLVRRLDGRMFAAAVGALEPDHAELVLAYLAGLTEAQRVRPILPPSAAGFELRLRRLVLRFLLRDAGSAFNRRAWLRRLLTSLAREGGVGYAELLAMLAGVVEALRTRRPPAGTLPAALAALAADLPPTQARHARDHQGEDAATSAGGAQAPSVSPKAYAADEPPPDRLAAAERFLRSGAPSALGPELTAIAAQRPAAFADLLRRLTRAASDAPGPLIERLLAWMAPEEVAECLWPDEAAAAGQWAGDLADAEGLDMASAWMRVLGAGLRGAALAPPTPAAVTLSRSVRDALLRHWLDHGTLAWWAPPGVTLADLHGDLAGRPAGALMGLFADQRPERVAARLRRAMTAAEGDDEALLRTLAPWAFARGGVLQTQNPGVSGAVLAELRLHAATAAVIGDGAVLTAPALAGPVSAPSAPAPAEAPSEDAVLFAWLSGEGSAAPPGPAAALGRRLTRGGRADPRLDAALRRGLGRPEARARLAAGLPHALLTHLVRRLAPGLARFVDDLIAVLALAFQEGQAHRILWETALAHLTAPPPPRVLADRLIAALAAGADREALRAAAAALARRHGHAHLAAVLTPTRPSASERPAAARQDPPGPEPGETHYVANAGLVLFNPFLPRFFETLGVLTVGEDGAQPIAGLAAASRAAHLLQYLVDGRIDTPEPELILNKVLCGLPPAAPIEPAIDLSDADRAACDSLLRAVIGNWTTISNTSPEGLREAFLQREGRLRRADDRWSLDVQRKTLDVLTDQIPWSIAIVYHRWMPDPLHVTW